MNTPKNRRILTAALAVFFSLAATGLAEARLVTASWDANSDLFTTGYRVLLGRQPGNYTSQIDVGNVTTRQLEVGPGTWFFAVVAYNALGQAGPASDVVSITLPNQPPTLVPLGDVAVPAGPINVQLPATDPDGDPLTFSLTGLPGASINPQTGVVSGFLYPAGTYPVVAAVTDGDAVTSRAFNVTISGTACPGPPAAPTLQAPVTSGTQVTLNWTRPTSGISPASFVILAGTASGRSDIASVDLLTTSITTITAFVSNGLYFVRVASRNACGDGVSNEQSFTIGGPAPGAPTGLTFTRSGRQVNLQWNAATGGPTSYVLEAGSAAGQSNLVVFNTGSTGTTFTADAPPGRYFVRIRAVNANGTGPASNEVIIDVP